MKATAYANVNFAFAKYWGKRNEELILPQTSSLSMTIDGFGSLTTVEFDSHYSKDQFILDGKDFIEGEEYNRAVGQLDWVRKMAKISAKAKVMSKNTVHTAAGLASSASGAAALAAAAAKAAGLNLSPKELSILSRYGSGSSCRSIYGGFAEWIRGEKKDGSDCYAEQLFDETYWPELRLIVTVVATAQKKVKTRAGQTQTVATSPYYKTWVETQDQDIASLKAALAARDFTQLGKVSEYNWSKFQSIMFTTQPILLYWLPTSVEIMHSIWNWRDEGLESYMTMDAGPQVKVICLEKDVAELDKRLKAISGVVETVVCKAGKGVEYGREHLF